MKPSTDIYRREFRDNFAIYQLSKIQQMCLYLAVTQGENTQYPEECVKR